MQRSEMMHVKAFLEIPLNFKTPLIYAACNANGCSVLCGV